MKKFNAKNSVKKFLVVSVASLGLIAPAVLPTVASASAKTESVDDLVNQHDDKGQDDMVNFNNQGNEQYQGNTDNPSASDIANTEKGRSNGSEPAKKAPARNRRNVQPRKPSARPAKSHKVAPVAPKQHVVIPKRSHKSHVPVLRPRAHRSNKARKPIINKNNKKRANKKVAKRVNNKKARKSVIPINSNKIAKRAKKSARFARPSVKAEKRSHGVFAPVQSAKRNGKRVLAHAKKAVAKKLPQTSESRNTVLGVIMLGVFIVAGYIATAVSYAKEKKFENKL